MNPSNTPNALSLIIFVHFQMYKRKHNHDTKFDSFAVTPLFVSPSLCLFSSSSVLDPINFSTNALSSSDQSSVKFESSSLLSVLLSLLSVSVDDESESSDVDESPPLLAVLIL